MLRTSLFRALGLALCTSIQSSALVQGAHWPSLSNSSSRVIETIQSSREDEAVRYLVNQQSDDLTALNVAQFEDELLHFGKDDFICDEVSVTAVKLIKPGQEDNFSEFGTHPFEHHADFSCVVHKKKLSTDMTFHYTLENVGPTFAEERIHAMAQNKTQLIIRNPAIIGSTLIIPDQTESVIDGNDSFLPVLEWHEPPEGSKSSDRRYTRRLAQAQFGTKSVLIFRVTVEAADGDISVPTKTPKEVHDSIFGFDGTDAVNLRSQYQACSYNQIDFLPADDDIIRPLFSNGVDGVIDITVTNMAKPLQTRDIEEAVLKKAQSNNTVDGELDLDLQEYDHVMLMLPPGSFYKGSTGWIAYAYKPGIESVYNDDKITSSIVQLHEIGHNLDLHHSGEISPNGGVIEYGDYTCTMGTGPMNDDTHRCFNAAKMAELGWYNKVISFNPTLEDFDGKVIGVADYANSAEDHYLVVEVINPVSTEEYIYLTLNTKKGINQDTGEKADMVTIVRARRTLPSTLFSALNDSDGSNAHTIENFFNGRDLNIVVDSMGIDNTVNYADVRIFLQIESCTTASDCSVGTNNCVSATCNTSTNKCEYQTVPSCCGNGICEESDGENCATCSTDCKKPDHCNDLGYFDLPRKCTKVHRTSGSWSPAGHMFDIEAVKDITIYAFEIMYAGREILGEDLEVVTPEVYVKKGTWVGSQFDPEAWDTVYSGKTIPVVIPNVTCPGPLYDDVILDHGIKLKAGETYGIYITLKEPAQLWMRPATNFVKKVWEDVGDVFIENNDIKIKAGVSPEYPFGLYVDFIGYPTYFIGRPKYSYGVKCYLDNQCDDGNSYTTDTCNTSTNECEFQVNTNTNICGNDICEAAVGENCSTCPEDCKIPADCNVLGLGINEFGEGWIDGKYRYNFDTEVNGNMFEIEALTDITIKAFEIYTFRDEYQENEKAQVWTKKGTYEGFEEMEEVWTTVLGSTTAKFNMERILLELTYPVRVKANEKQTFYVAIEDSWTLNYKEGTDLGSIVMANADLRILEGVALGRAWFTKVSKSPAKFYGSVRYEYGHQCYNQNECDDGHFATVDTCSQSGGANSPGVCLNPYLQNICGNRLCEPTTPNLETWYSCPSDCEVPNVNMTTVGRWAYDETINPYQTPKGMMFDLEGINDITIYGIDLGVYFPDSVGEIEIYVTTKSNSSFVGNERYPSKWTRVHNSSVTWKKNTPGAKLRLQAPFRIKASAKRGVYVTFTDTSYHALVTTASLGTGVGNVVAETADIRLLEGTSNGYPFGIDPVGPKVFFGRVRYFKGTTCTFSSECDDLNAGTTDSCDEGQCRNVPIPGICGNGVCEVSVHHEYCSSCPSDCDGMRSVCNELNGIVVSNSMSTSSAVKGIVFTIKALTDVTFYEIHAAMSQYTKTVNANVYTKMGSFNGESNLNRWDLVFSGTVEQFCTSGRFCSTAVMKFPLTATPPVRTPAGKLRTFYLDLSTSPPLYNKDANDEPVVYSNDDMEVYSSTTVGADLDTIVKNEMIFSGLLKYDFGLVPWPCETAADCDDNNAGTSDACVQGTCSNIPIPNVCGNGICETWGGERCSTCPDDCGPSFYCDEIDQEDGYQGSYSASNMRGIAFDIEAVRSLAVSEISVRVGYGVTSSGAKVYTKEGSYKDSLSLDDWTLVFDEDNAPVKNNLLSLALSPSTPTDSAAGSKRSFYVTLSQASRIVIYGDQQEGAVVKENNDIKVYAGEVYNGNFGTVSRTGYHKLRGIIKYDFTEIEAPSEAPSFLPTKDDTPPEESQAPSESPSKSPVPVANDDSPFKFKFITKEGQEKWRYCSWLKRNPTIRCNLNGEFHRIASHCPDTCGVSSVCVDAMSNFIVGTDNSMACDTIESTLSSPCQASGVSETCRRLCPTDIEDVRFYGGKNSNGKTRKKLCWWLRGVTPEKRNEVCNISVEVATAENMVPASKVCVSTCNSCNTFPVPDFSLAPSNAPSESPPDCLKDSDTEKFFNKVKKNGDINVKGCRWLQRLANLASQNAQKLSKLRSICASTTRYEQYRAGGEVCPQTCENHKIFYKGTNKKGIEVRKSCLWLQGAKRDDRRDAICAKTAEAPSDGLKPPKEVCFLTCKKCPPE